MKLDLLGRSRLREVTAWRCAIGQEHRFGPIALSVAGGTGGRWPLQ